MTGIAYTNKTLTRIAETVPDITVEQFKAAADVFYRLVDFAEVLNERGITRELSTLKDVNNLGVEFIQKWDAAHEKKT